MMLTDILNNKKDKYATSALPRRTRASQAREDLIKLAAQENRFLRMLAHPGLMFELDRLVNAICWSLHWSQSLNDHPRHEETFQTLAGITGD